MNHYRAFAACTVFEGKIVVSGGMHTVHLKSVEAYDHYENKWNFLPNMNFGKYKQGAVSMDNKMFVIDGCNRFCEVFHSYSRKFTKISQVVQVSTRAVNTASVTRLYFFIKILKILLFMMFSRISGM